MKKRDQVKNKEREQASEAGVEIEWNEWNVWNKVSNDFQREKEKEWMKKQLRKNEKSKCVKLEIEINKVVNVRLRLSNNPSQLNYTLLL